MDRMLPWAPARRWSAASTALRTRTVALPSPRHPRPAQTQGGGIRCSTRTGRSGHGAVEAVEGRHHGRGIALNDDGGDAGDDHGPGHEAMNLPMSVIWSAIRNWIDQGLV